MSAPTAKLMRAEGAAGPGACTGMDCHGRYDGLAMTRGRVFIMMFLSGCARWRADMNVRPYGKANASRRCGGPGGVYGDGLPRPLRRARNDEGKKGGLAMTHNKGNDEVKRTRNGYNMCKQEMIF